MKENRGIIVSLVISFVVLIGLIGVVVYLINPALITTKTVLDGTSHGGQNQKGMMNMIIWIKMVE